MTITQETRRAAYQDTRTLATTRRRVLYDALNKYGPQTADQLMDRLGYQDPNAVRPRLTELKKAGLIETAGKAQSRRTGKMTALWRVPPPQPVPDDKKAAACGCNTDSGSARNNTTEKIPQEEDDVNG